MVPSLSLALAANVKEAGDRKLPGAGLVSVTAGGLSATTVACPAISPAQLPCPITVMVLVPGVLHRSVRLNGRPETANVCGTSEAPGPKLMVSAPQGLTPVTVTVAG